MDRSLTAGSFTPASVIWSVIPRGALTYCVSGLCYPTQVAARKSNSTLQNVLLLLGPEIVGGARASMGQVSPGPRSRYDGDRAKDLLFVQGRLGLLRG